MTSEYRKVGDVPTIAVRAKRVSPLGSVFWYHGFGVDKDANHKELELLADAGFDAIGIDVVGHGERRAPDLDERMAGTQAEALASVEEFAAATADELPRLMTDALDSGFLRSPAVSAAGISMGAFVVYRAVINAPLLRSAVALLGSPEFPDADSPHRHAAAMCRVPLLSITGECDTNVPPGPARRLHEMLDSKCARGHRYIELPGAEHLMDEASWNNAMSYMIDWLRMAH